MEDILLKLLAPAITMIVVWLVSLIRKNLPDWVVTTIVVPVVSALQTWIQGLLGSVPDPTTHLLLNLVATWIFEFLKNIQAAVRRVLAGPAAGGTR